MEEGEKIGIYSRHILLFSETVPIHGLVVIQGELIIDVYRFDKEWTFDGTDYPDVSILNFEEDYV
jgi:hypothetical protein